jgi:hypothetical protein
MFVWNWNRAIHSPSSQINSATGVEWSRHRTKILSNDLLVEMGSTNTLAELGLLTVLVPHQRVPNRS